jgi:acetyltransferase
LDEKIIGKTVKPYSHLVISPYPKEYMDEFKMKGGKTVTLRPIRPEDEPEEAEMFDHFSPATLRQRFLGQEIQVTHDLLLRFTQIDYDREIAIVGEITVNKQKKFIGVVRLISDPANTSAEFTVIVADPWQNKGLGNKFVDYILHVAKERGVKKVTTKLFKDNVVYYRMLEKLGFTFRANDHADVLLAELKIDK